MKHKQSNQLKSLPQTYTFKIFFSFILKCAPTNVYFAQQNMWSRFIEENNVIRDDIVFVPNNFNEILFKKKKNVGTHKARHQFASHRCAKCYHAVW